MLPEKIQAGYIPKENEDPFAYNLYKYLKPHPLKVEKNGSPIVEFLRNKTILITGGTGFLGKLTIEKLLRSCNEIDRIILIVRAKKGKDFQERIDKILDDEIFSKLKEIFPDFKNKIVGINGDMALPQLGLSKGDRKMIQEEVNIIYHGAATVSFTEHIRKAVEINVKGTEEMLKIAKNSKKLISFVHLSTAYSHCNQHAINEKFYEPTMSPEKIYKIMEAYSDEELERLTPSLIGKMPNTYAFTKQIAESLVQKLASDIPVCVLRPSIVTCTYKEPLKGWIDNLYGPMGMIVGGGTGFLHTGFTDLTKKADLVPGDYVVNALIAVSYKTAISSNNRNLIYNCVSGEKNPLTWGHFSKCMQNECTKWVPTMKAVWAVFFYSSSNKRLFELYFFLFQMLPAIFVDAILTIIRKKPFLVKTNEKIYKYIVAISFFATKEWTISDKNIESLWNSLQDVDKKNFNFDIKTIDWGEYLLFCCYGLRVFVVKDPLSTLEEARKRQQKLYILHQIVKLFFAFLVLRYLYLFSLLFYRIIFTNFL